jgi:hypothetical protein
MKSFSLVPTSEGPRREFTITWGLRAGYGPSGRIYDLLATNVVELERHPRRAASAVGSPCAGSRLDRSATSGRGPSMW